MTKEQEYFLSTIKDYINGYKTVAKDVNWDTIYNLSQSHQLTAIIYHQCKDFISSPIAESFKSTSISTVYININRKKLTDDTMNVLKENGINCFLIKGLDIADFYPKWQYRTMGDSDIVVDDLEKTHDILIEEGFKNLTKNKDAHYQYLKQNMEFEIHDRLVYEGITSLDKVTKFLNSYKEYIINGKLDNSFRFIFVIDHLRKHFMNSGVGFRQFVDVAVLIKNDKKINWVWAQKKLDEIGLLPFAKIVFYYIDRWFGVKAPIEAKIVSEDIFEASTEYVFNNGVFGFDNKENKNFSVSNKVSKAKNQKLAMLKIALQRIFPSYKSMANVKWYSFLKGKPILLPLAWIYRFFRGIHRKGLNEGINMISKSFVSKEYIDKREEMFRNWGLE